MATVTERPPYNDRRSNDEKGTQWKWSSNKYN